jgi:histidine kinase
MEGLIDGVLPPKQDTFQYIYHEADRLQRLVSDLQELSRVEMQVSAMRPGRLQARSLIQSAVDRLKNQFEEKGVDLNWEVEDHLPTLWADEDRIGQILLNILGNALQYTPQGGKVDIRVRRKEDEVHFRIEDSGLGISPEHLPHIFKRFYRVDKSRSRISGGTGIGLTIARQLVKANGGRIWAESAGDDQGSTFTFTLPILGLPEEE